MFIYIECNVNVFGHCGGLINDYVVSHGFCGHVFFVFCKVNHAYHFLSLFCLLSLPPSFSFSPSLPLSLPPSPELTTKGLQKSALRYLVILLPRPNRDTLQELLQFLCRVALHSNGIILMDGTEVRDIYKIMMHIHVHA